MTSAVGDSSSTGMSSFMIVSEADPVAIPTPEGMPESVTMTDSSGSVMASPYTARRKESVMALAAIVRLTHPPVIAGEASLPDSTSL